MKVLIAVAIALSIVPMAASAHEGSGERSLMNAPPKVSELTAAVRQKLQTARSRLTAQREAVAATELRAAGCRERFQDEAMPTPEGGATRLDAYRRCMAGGEG
jgi:hypothetical protein